MALDSCINQKVFKSFFEKKNQIYCFLVSIIEDIEVLGAMGDHKCVLIAVGAAPSQQTNKNGYIIYNMEILHAIYGFWDITHKS